MEDTKKMDEAAKPEELSERTPLTDDQLDQVSGGSVWRRADANKKIASLDFDAAVLPFE